MGAIMFEMSIVLILLLAILAYNLFLFRRFINKIIFIGMSGEEIREVVMSHSFFGRFFLTYVRDYEDSPEFGLAKWFLRWYRASLEATFVSFAIVLADVFFEVFFARRLYIGFGIFDFYVTERMIDNFLGVIIFGAFPISFVFALPEMLRLRKSRADFNFLRRKAKPPKILPETEPEPPAAEKVTDFEVRIGLWWRIVVAGDKFALHRPFRDVLEFTLGDISTAKIVDNHCKVFMDGKKIFSVNKFMPNYEFLHEMLFDAKKFDFLQVVEEEEFTVRGKPSEIITYICLAVFCVFAVPLGLWLDLEEVVGALFFTPFFCFNAFTLAKIRITVAGDNFTVRRMLGAEREYEIKQITKVDLKRNNAILYVGERKIRVHAGYENFTALALRLKNAGIPTYHNGEMVE